MHGLRVYLSIAVAILATSLAAPAAAQSLASSQTAERMLVNGPPGFHDSCRRYGRLCKNHAANAQPVGAARLLGLARSINRRVNFTVSQLSDPENYSAAEYWSLPTNGSGDCEDFVLQKYKLLLNAGVDSRDLSIAVVLGRQGNNHAVLVLRHNSGDLVLDSLVSRVLPWNQTGYRFLAMQSGDDKTQWEFIANQP